MGWWRTEDGELLGDGPVDLVIDVLRGIRDRCGEEWGSPPTLAELLGVLDHVIRSDAERIISDPGTIGEGRVAAELDGGEVVVAKTPPELDPEMTGEVLEGLEEIALEYLDAEVRRRPTLGEVLGTLDFALGPDPGEYVAGGESLAIQRVLLSRA